MVCIYGMVWVLGTVEDSIVEATEPHLSASDQVMEMMFALGGVLKSLVVRIRWHTVVFFGVCVIFLDLGAVVMNRHWIWHLQFITPKFGGEMIQS